MSCPTVPAGLHVDVALEPGQHPADRGQSAPPRCHISLRLERHHDGQTLAALGEVYNIAVARGLLQVGDVLADLVKGQLECCIHVSMVAAGDGDPAVLQPADAVPLRELYCNSSSSAPLRAVAWRLWPLSGT
jgi:hypothetical protein